MGKKFLKFEYLLLFAVFIIATCGLIYELIAGTLASYLLGDSVKQFSFIIGVYLFSMGWKSAGQSANYRLFPPALRG